MKKILTIIILTLFTNNLFAADTYFEKKSSFQSPKVLAMGNSFVAEAQGLESFEFNPAGLNGKRSITILNGNFNLISNFFQLNEDLVDAYNNQDAVDSEISNVTDDIGFYLDPDNRRKIIGALLKQTSTPYNENSYANGLGLTGSLSMGIAGNGFGLGLLVSLDSEVYGEELLDTDLNSVLTTSLLIGYGRSLDLGIIKLDLGVALRPMYKVRSISDVSTVVDLIVDEDVSLTDESFLGDLEYMTGIGLGIDVGAKVHFMGLTAGLSIMDLFGTSIAYTKNTYQDIVDGNYLGSETVDDEYITPSTIKLGLGFNPGLGNFSKVFNPTISLDYNVLFIDEGSVKDYATQGTFWTNLSMGAELELFSFISLRGGLNQGYVTLGAGLELFIFDINFGVYSKELGKEVGDRQQMGAALEIGIRI